MGKIYKNENVAKQLEKSVNELLNSFKIIQKDIKGLNDNNDNDESYEEDNHIITYPSGINDKIIGEKCIVRSYADGVWFGEVIYIEDRNVIVKDARRMYRWQAISSITLSAIAIDGIDQSRSKICAPLPLHLTLNVVGITPCSKVAIKSLEEAPIAQQE